ncbi:hypothetical protein BACCAP_00636 [Pseudoflavonifractor capillosus ATCC 29799]|uniref:Uncharacterized protein n=1 Tax=Pseudoflavonifractor capillosus ATCC 29799 TaxID=411467 RepID=A6NR12_9FIRM|nr:hypothetical protein BACCAP_00636 [Pseudoflavonifractor capillosus ATCC 29799]
MESNAPPEIFSKAAVQVPIWTGIRYNGKNSGTAALETEVDSI